MRRRRERPAVESSIPASILAPHSTAVGRLESEQDLILAGSFEGQLRCARSVQLLSGSSLRGDVQAAEIIVQGVVTGNLLARQRIRILHGGAVDGDVCAPEVTVQEGVALNARVRMLTNGEETREVLLPVLLRPESGTAPRQWSALLDATQEFLETLGFVCETRPRPSLLMRCIFRSSEPIRETQFRERLAQVEQALQNATVSNETDTDPGPHHEAELAAATRRGREFLVALGDSQEAVAVVGITVVRPQHSTETDSPYDIQQRREFLPGTLAESVPRPAELLLAMQGVQDKVLGETTAADPVSET